jgi:acetyl-CoA carboxylase carboxyltransferase component
MLFMEDTTGFLPGRDQESRGIVQAGRAMLDAIIDLRVPRFLLIIRNAFGGAYAAFNNYKLGADMVFALPTTRLAVMGPAGKEFVYKDELKALRLEAKTRAAKGDAEATQWLKEQEMLLGQRYEAELMNPKEALSLGSISQIVMPQDLRHTLGDNFIRYIKAYQPKPMTAIQREFH